MTRRVLVVSTVPLEDDQLESIGVDPGSDEIKVVAPAAKLSRLDWLTNDEDEARREAATTAVQTANAVPHAAEADVGDPDPVQAIEDALREWPADEVVVVTSSGDEATWLEERADETRHRIRVPVTRLALDGG